MMNKTESYTTESYTIEGIRDFDPVHTFECGQCFRWEQQPDGSYTGVAMGRIVNIRYDAEPGTATPAGDTTSSFNEPNRETVEAANGALTITPCAESEFNEIWRPYLDLDRDYRAIKKTLSADDEIMRKACEYGYGIRILRQDLWETIVSFIISQNNNIPRIKGCIERLCDNFGEPIPESGSTVKGESMPNQMTTDKNGFRPEQDDDRHADQRLSLIGTARYNILSLIGTARYNIPAPETLAALTVEDLAPVRLGYRAKYLIETAKSVCEKGLPEDFDELSALCGVGPKVASCIALFGMQDYASFPIDVWVMKVMHELYGLPEKDKKQMAQFAHEHFGELGGFAQQYLFYYMRDRN